MTSRDFCFWLQGYFEIQSMVGEMDAASVDCVRRHLALVFKHEIDPSMGPPAHQAKLDQTHAPACPGIGPGGDSGLKFRC